MISTQAYIHPDAKLGKNVIVEPFAYIAGDVVIDDECRIYTGAVVLDGTRMGARCQIHPSAVVGGIPQDLKFKGEYTTLEMGDDNVVRECVTISRGTAARGKTVVGSNNLLMAYVHIGHDCVVGDRTVLANRVSLGGEVEIGDWAILGGHCAVHQFCRVGAHAMVSGGSLVSKDVPPYVKAAHNPLSFVGSNYIGLRRRGFVSEKITEIQEIFRILFQMGYGYGRACDIITEQIPQSLERDLIIDFVRDSKRGILKPYNAAKEGEDID